MAFRRAQWAISVDQRFSFSPFYHCTLSMIVRYMSSPVRPSVRLSVTFVRPIQAIEIFGNVSTPFGTFAIH